MSVTPPNPQRPTSLEEDETSSAGELAVALWVIAVLIAVLELTWWMFGRMYAS